MKKIFVLVSILALFTGIVGGLAFVLLTGGSPGEPGGPPMPIVGTVTDAVDAKLGEVRIQLDTYSTTSRPDGSFGLPELRDGTYEIKLARGDARSTHRVEIKAGAVSAVDGIPTDEFILSLPVFARDYRRIPAVDPTKDIVTDGEGFRIIKDTVEIIWKKESSPEERKSALAALPGIEVRAELSEIPLTEASVPNGDLDKVIAALERQTAVKAATKNYVVDEQFEPKDPDWADEDRSWWLRRVEAQQSWEISAGSGAVTVAVIDGGFQLDHPDLANVFLPQLATNYTSDDVGAHPDHGTHVSGIIAMQANELGLVGIAPKVKIMPIKAYTVAQQADAMGLATRTRGVRVISMSQGINWWRKNARRAQLRQARFTEEEMRVYAEREDLILIPAAQNVKEKDLVMAHSAGNDGQSAKYNTLNTDAIVTVANSTRSDSIAKSSNFGPPVTVRAPGTSVWSSVGGSSFDASSGTSMSTPLVAGTIAAMRAANPRLSATEVMELLVKSAEPIKRSAPLLNAWQAMLSATSQYGIRGAILDQDNNPISGATVYPQGMKALAQTTAGNGMFIIPAIPRTGPWELVIESGGEQTVKNLERLPDGQFVLRDILLKIGEKKPVAEPPKERKLEVTFVSNWFRNICNFAGGYEFKKKMLLRAGGPIALSGSDYTGSLSKGLAANGLYGEVFDVTYHGEILSLKEGGKALIEMDGFYADKYPEYGIDNKVPIHALAEGTISKVAKTQYKNAETFTLTTDKFSVDPFTIFAQRDSSGRNVLGECRYDYTAGGSPAQTIYFEIKASDP